MSNKKYRSTYHNEDAAFPILEALISMGVSLILLTVFFTSLNNTYNIIDNPTADLEDKNLGIIELLMGSPGYGSTYNPNWEEDPDNLGALGLGTSPTVAYGIIYIDPDTGEATLIGDQYEFSGGGIGEQCFLGGTKILMVDDSYKNIEDIKAGEMVKSYDEKNRGLVSGRVTDVFHYSAEEMMYDYYLLINDVLQVTPNHRFYLLCSSRLQQNHTG